MTEDGRILVTGATGSIGRMLVDELVRAGARVRALTTDPARAALPPEAEVVVGFIGRPETVPPALEGVQQMYLAPLPETVDEVVGMASEAGVKRIVDLSGPEGNWWYSVAAAVERCGVEWTHLWPGEFMENYLMWAAQIRTASTVRDAHPGAANAPVAMADVAAVAAVSLLEEGHVGQGYELTGPESITRADMVRLIGEAIGREIPYVELSHGDAVKELTPVLGEYAGWYLEGAAELVDNPQTTLPTVETILGRPATSFKQWAVAHIDDFGGGDLIDAC